MARHVSRQRQRPEYVQRILNSDVLPRWGSRDSRTIKPREVIELLDEIADRAPVMANRVASVLSQMFRFGIHRSIVESLSGAVAVPPRWQGKGEGANTFRRRKHSFLIHLEEPAAPGAGHTYYVCCC